MYIILFEMGQIFQNLFLRDSLPSTFTSHMLLFSPNKIFRTLRTAVIIEWS